MTGPGPRVTVLTEDDGEFDALRDAIHAAVGRPCQVERVVEGSQADQGPVPALESARQTYDDFLYRVSHDLRQPLHVMSGYLELLEIGHAGSLGPDGLRMLGRAQGGVERMKALLDGLLELSRVRADRAIMQPLDLGESFDEAVNLLADRFEQAGATVQRDPLPVVVGDRTLIRRVWTCLLTNGLDHAGAAPPILVARVHRVGHSVRLSLTDRGEGIPPEDLERVFGVFQRGVGKTGAPIGLGLAMVRRVVELHGGRAWAESTPGVGTTLHFTLPATAGDGRREGT